MGAPTDESINFNAMMLLPHQRPGEEIERLYPSEYTGREGADEGEVFPRDEFADPGPRGRFEPTPTRLIPGQCRETGFLIAEPPLPPPLADAHCRSLPPPPPLQRSHDDVILLCNGLHSEANDIAYRTNRYEGAVDGALCDEIRESDANNDHEGDVVIIGNTRDEGDLDAQKGLRGRKPDAKRPELIRRTVQSTNNHCATRSNGCPAIGPVAIQPGPRGSNWAGSRHDRTDDDPRSVRSVLAQVCFFCLSTASVAVAPRHSSAPEAQQR